MFSKIPAAPIVITSEDPPNETKGSGTPVTGSTPITAPMLIRACPTTHAVMPAASNAHQAPEGAQLDAADEQQGQHDAAEDERRAHVGLPHDEERSNAEHEKNRPQRRPRVALGAPSRQHVGREQQNCELGELGG